MNRQRKIDEDLWDDGDEEVSSDHVVERFFSRREREPADVAHGKPPGTPRPRRRPARSPDTEE